MSDVILTSVFTCPECGTVKAGFIAYEPPAN